MIYRVPMLSLPDARKVGRIRYANGWSDEYCHKRNILIFVCSGRFVYTFSPTRKITLSAGTHLLIPAGTHYTAQADEDCDYFFIQFESQEPIVPVRPTQAAAVLKKQTEAQKIARQSDYDAPPERYLYIDETQTHRRSLDALRYRLARCAEFQRGISPLDRMRMTDSFFRVLLSLATDTGGHLVDTEHFSPAFIKLRRFIEENYTEKLTLRGLSRHFVVSEQYIMRLFREQAGTTVTRYINEVRLQKSLDLLVYHSLSVSEVAWAVGFSGLYYFDRLFKKTYGITPTQYQKNHRLTVATHKNNAENP